MKGLAGGVFVVLVGGALLIAQERDRSLARISLALQPPPIERGVGEIESTLPKTFGIVTLVPPIKRGEVIRVSVPVGEFVSRAFKGVAAANQRRQEAAARRRVAAELKALEEQRRRAAVR